MLHDSDLDSFLSYVLKSIVDVTVTIHFCVDPVCSHRKKWYAGWLKDNRLGNPWGDKEKVVWVWIKLSGYVILEPFVIDGGLGNIYKGTYEIGEI